MQSSRTNLGVNILYLRKSLKLNQTQLGQEVGLSRNNIASYESGKVEPSSKNLLKICKYFEISPALILTEILSESNKHNKQVTSIPGEQESSEAEDHISEFAEQTLKMTQILEGYQTFYEMQKLSISTQAERELYSTMDNVLDLLRSLVNTNMKLVKSIHEASV